MPLLCTFAFLSTFLVLSFCLFSACCMHIRPCSPNLFAWYQNFQNCHCVKNTNHCYLCLYLFVILLTFYSCCLHLLIIYRYPTLHHCPLDRIWWKISKLLLLLLLNSPIVFLAGHGLLGAPCNMFGVFVQCAHLCLCWYDLQQRPLAQ